jgi:hypothetical protein
LNCLFTVDPLFAEINLALFLELWGLGNGGVGDAVDDNVASPSEDGYLVTEYPPLQKQVYLSQLRAF